MTTTTTPRPRVRATALATAPAATPTAPTEDTSTILQVQLDELTTTSADLEAAKQRASASLDRALADGDGTQADALEQELADITKQLERGRRRAAGLQERIAEATAREAASRHAAMLDRLIVLTRDVGPQLRAEFDRAAAPLARILERMRDVGAEWNDLLRRLDGAGVDREPAVLAVERDGVWAGPHQSLAHGMPLTELVVLPSATASDAHWNCARGETRAEREARREAQALEAERGAAAERERRARYGEGAVITDANGTPVTYDSRRWATPVGA